MKKLKIDQTFFQVFPECQLGILSVSNIDNKRNLELSVEMIERSRQIGEKFISNKEFGTNSLVLQWKRAQERFPGDESAKVGLEILLEKIHKGETIPSVNPLVNIIHSIAVEYGVNVWGVDSQSIVGNLTLVRSEGNELFVDQEGKEEYPEIAEFIYKDDLGAITRSWNWKQGCRSLISENTKNANIILEQLDRKGDLDTAIREMTFRIQQLLGGYIRIKHLDYQHTWCSLGVNG